MKQNFRNMFEDLFLPVIICKNDANASIAYMNKKARLLLAPTHSVEEIKGKKSSDTNLNSILRFKTEEEYFTLVQRLQRI